MRYTTLTIIILIALATQVSAQNKPFLKQRSDASVVALDQRLFAGMNFKVPVLTDTALYGGYDSIGLLLQIKSGSLAGLWLRDTVLTGGHEWVRLAATNEAVNYWQLSDNELSPTSTSDSVGIGGAPNRKFDVFAGAGNFGFDGARIHISDTLAFFNMLIGGNAGLGFDKTTDKENIAMGARTMENAHGIDNVALGYNILQYGYGDKNTAVGYKNLLNDSGSYNTSIGYISGIGNYGDSDIAIGANSGNFIQLAQGTLNNSETVLSSFAYTGATTTTFISTNSLSVGEEYPFSLNFVTGVIPEPYNTGGIQGLYVRGRITDASTITFTGLAFTTHGTGTATLKLLNKQYNSIAIGYNTQTDSTNQIKIGNDSSSILKSNAFVVDTRATPHEGWTLVWHTDRYTPDTVAGGGGVFGFTSPLHESGGTVTIDDAAADGATIGVSGFNATDFDDNGAGIIALDYTNGQKASSVQPGFLSAADFDTFKNSRQPTVTGAASTITNSNAAANRVLVSNGSGKVAASSITTTDLSTMQSQAANSLSTTLANGAIWIGNASNVATARIMSGAATISNTGVLTLANSAVTAGTYSNANITVNAKGIITAAADGTGGGGGTGTVTTVTASSPIIITSNPLITPNVTIQNGKADGTTLGAMTGSTNDFNDNGTGLFSIDWVNTQKATSLQNGALLAADWATFNNKVSTTRSIIAGTGLTGGGTLAADRTINLANTAVTAGAYTSANITIDAQGRITSAANGSGGGGSGTVTNFIFTNGGGFTGTVGTSTSTPTLSLTLQNGAADGTTKGQATFAAADFNATTGLISIDYTNGQAATSTTKGFVTSTDWVAFNAKQGAITGASSTVTSANLTANRAAISNASGKLDVSAVTTTELAFVSGATSNIQTQIDGKEPLVTYPFQTVTYGATSTMNCNSGYHGQLTLAGNATLALTNFGDGHIVILEVIQDGTGSRVLTLPAGSVILDAGGVGTAPILSTAAGAKDVLSGIKNGSAIIWKISRNAQ